MNPVLLFIGGIVLGVLLSLSFVNRTSPSTTSYDLTTATDKISDPIVSSNTINNLSVTENVNVSFAKLVDSPVSVERKDTDNSLRTRWAPGKEGGLAKLKSLADQSQSFFVSNEEIVGATSASPGTNIASATGSNGDLEKMRPAQLKRKHRQEQLNKRINGPGGSTSTATTTTVSTATTTTNNLATPMSTTLSHTINTLSPSTFNASLPRLSSTSNPFIPYHSQASTDFSTFKAYIPSLEAVSAQQRSSAGMPPLPDMSKQRGAHETENLKLHHCNGVFEAYSASYLTTRQHMLNVASEGYNLSWVNCEMASFIHMKESNKFYSNPQADGLIMQSLDVLDLSVIHLSAFERSSKKYRHLLWTSKADMNTQWMKIDPVKRAGSRLSDLNNPVSPTYRKIRYSPEAQRTVVIMPFLGGAMGAGHSELGNRFEYLKACFWSFYEFVPNIVAGVTRQEDVDWCMKESGLPFFDIILLSNLPKSAGLPVGLTQQAKLRLQDGRWSDFDYVFFTESDQILISRELPLMYEHLKKYPGHMILPHRLMPYSDRVVSEVHKRDIATMRENAWMNQSCCLPRQNCLERKTWLPIKDKGVPFINYYGLYVPLGNVNFLDEKFRACRMSPYVGDYCP